MGIFWSSGLFSAFFVLRQVKVGFHRLFSKLTLHVTLGGVTNGNDMVAAHLRQNKWFPPAVVEDTLSMTDVEGRPEGVWRGEEGRGFHRPDFLEVARP